MGHSMGGAIAIRAAVQLPEIRLVIAESVYTNFGENAERLAVSFAECEFTGPLVLPWAEQIAGRTATNWPRFGTLPSWRRAPFC